VISERFFSAVGGQAASAPTVLATPHLGYVEQDSYELYFSAAFENIVQFAAGNPVNILNPDALG